MEQQNLKETDFNLTNMLIDIMSDANFLTISGKAKKTVVLDEVKLLIGPVTYARYEPLLSMAVDTIVSISKKDVKLVLKKSSRLCKKLSKGCS
tara:strand:- start:3373 stop:3651 length:279 start_codon:yes stop_codon:yes gene_type:complete